ncbi:MAG: AAA family ATPase [Fimbriimonadaceae bacterium]|nr:AAA family ATPase [Fimbriimonadaceae bacterium]
MSQFIPFDSTRERIGKALGAVPAVLSEVPSLCFVRDLMGRVRILVDLVPETGTPGDTALAQFCVALQDRLGAHTHPVAQMVLALPDLEELTREAREVPMGAHRVRFLDRQVTGLGWSAVPRHEGQTQHPTRLTFYSVKGGVGRTTAAVVLAKRLAEDGHRVLMLDLDLEAPGLATALLEPDAQAEFGVADWFVEDLVEQAQYVEVDMVARAPIARDLPGDILVAGAHGRDPGDYLAKLGRVYLDKPPTDDRPAEPWTQRLVRLVEALEARYKPTVVLLDSRSGVHDIAAAAVTALDATVLLFAGGSNSALAGYQLLFRYWQKQGVAAQIREHLKLVAALVPETEQPAHIERLQQVYWDLFLDTLYDCVEPENDQEPESAQTEDPEPFSYDLTDETAPHAPLPIYWHRGLAGIVTLRALDQPVISAAYEKFLNGVTDLLPELEAT